MITPQAMFTDAISAQCDVQCPAVQNAIDRIVAGEYFRGRDGMLEALRCPIYRRSDFVSALLSAWKPHDISLATGRDLDGWIAVLDRLKA